MPPVPLVGSVLCVASVESLFALCVLPWLVSLLLLLLPSSVGLRVAIATVVVLLWCRWYC
jgi:hypothetical protein